jgi:hypothetical protein
MQYFHMTSLDDSSRSRYEKTRVRLRCPACTEEFVVADIDKFLSRTKFLWRLLMMNINDSHTKQKLWGTLAIINSHEGIVQDMQNTGLATVFCFSCIADLSEYYYQRKRIKYKMVGNVPLPDTYPYSMIPFAK